MFFTRTINKQILKMNGKFTYVNNQCSKQIRRITYPWRNYFICVCSHLSWDILKECCFLPRSKHEIVAIQSEIGSALQRWCTEDYNDQICSHSIATAAQEPSLYSKWISTQVNKCTHICTNKFCTHTIWVWWGNAVFLLQVCFSLKHCT